MTVMTLASLAGRAAAAEPRPSRQWTGRRYRLRQKRALAADQRHTVATTGWYNQPETMNIVMVAWVLLITYLDLCCILRAKHQRSIRFDHRHRGILISGTSGTSDCLIGATRSISGKSPSYYLFAPNFRDRKVFDSCANSVDVD